MLNRLLMEEGKTGMPGQITAAAVRSGEQNRLFKSNLK
jgi:hypothetical protein